VNLSTGLTLTISRNMEETRNKIYLALNIHGFTCAPGDITRDIGLQPTEAWEIGDLVYPRVSLRHKKNGWSLASGLSKYASFEEHMNALLDKVEPVLPAFAKVARLYYTELACAIYVYHENGESKPAVHLDTRSVRIVEALGAEVDFDLYYL
jgi:Domain of unknown function (DUF4279)